jgi:hypothetical protein
MNDNTTVTRRGRGTWYARHCPGEVGWGEACWTVESSTGFSMNMDCHQFIDRDNKLLIDFGDTPLTQGLTEYQAKQIAKLLNGGEDNDNE